MLKSSVIIICVLFVVINYGSGATNEQSKENLGTNTGGGDTLEATNPALVALEMDENEKFEPEIPEVKYPILQSSNVVNNDGSFALCSNANGVFIEVTGILVNINGTQKLELQGKYKFGDKNVWFYANQYGFNEVEPPQHIPPRVVSSILG